MCRCLRGLGFRFDVGEGGADATADGAAEQLGDDAGDGCENFPEVDPFFLEVHHEALQFADFDGHVFFESFDGVGGFLAVDVDHGVEVEEEFGGAAA